MVTQQQFLDYTQQGYNRIPLVREILADLETPLSTYLKLAAKPYSYVLESVEGGSNWGRYSIIGLPCQQRIEVRGKQVAFIDGDEQQIEEVADPLQRIREFMAQYSVPDIADLPRFTGGLVGYFGYNTICHIEGHLGQHKGPDPIAAPDICFLVSQEVVVFDNLSGRMYLIVHVDPATKNAYQSGLARLDSLVDLIGRGMPVRAAGLGQGDAIQEHGVSHSFDKQRYIEALATCRQYIQDGDIFQVVLSQRMGMDYHGDPLDVYRALRTLNPSPYMYFMDMGDYQIAGSSPEILVRLQDGEVTLRPIAGTRSRGADAAADAALEADLLADPKEVAEHLMLVDLGRNDVGRVAEVGSVRVDNMMSVEKYSHVMHIVSNVKAQKRPELDAIDVLKATFPAGTLSGAPKVRAMEIIEELEPEQRGIYSGALGYLAWNGNMDTCIVIRTALVKDGRVYVQAGAGIVADSVAESEWKETVKKGRAVVRAVEMASRGLNHPLTEED